MKISFENIDQQNDPFQLFIDSIKNDETKRRYKNILNRFLKLIPNQIYQDIIEISPCLREKSQLYLDKSGLKLIPNQIYQDIIEISPADRELNTLSSCFVKLAQKDPKHAQNIIVAYIKEDKKLVESGQLNPNTLPNHVKPIRALLDANSVPIHWKSLHKLYPRPKNTEDR